MNTQQSIRETVRQGYAEIATNGSSCCESNPGGCGQSRGDDANALAASIGYTTDELHALPEGANMGLSCGNPTALASLKPGEVVVDLGSGGGFDVFIAGKKVGPEGRIIGIDMTAEMLFKARRNAEIYRERTGLDNVEFRMGEIEHLPLPDNSVDVVISNCVINLSPEKAQVWREMARVLKPGGRVAVGDIALLKPLPPSIIEAVEALVGCLAGAVLVSETERFARDAGFEAIEFEAKPSYIDSMTAINDPIYRKIDEALPPGAKAGDYVASVNFSALKPSAACCGTSCCA